MKTVNIMVDLSHLDGPYGSQDYMRPLPVQLTDDEFEQLRNAQHDWRQSESSVDTEDFPVTDDEYYLKLYVPDVFMKIRKELEIQAANLWGEEILSQLKAIDIYVPEIMGGII